MEPEMRNILREAVTDMTPKGRFSSHSYYKKGFRHGQKEVLSILSDSDSFQEISSAITSYQVRSSGPHSQFVKGLNRACWEALEIVNQMSADEVALLRQSIQEITGMAENIPFDISPEDLAARINAISNKLRSVTDERESFTVVYETDSSA